MTSHVPGRLLAMMATLVVAGVAIAKQPTSTTSIAGQTEVSRLVDLAAQKLKVRVEYDPAQLKGAVTVRGAGEGGIPDVDLWDSVNSALAGRGFTTIASAKGANRDGGGPSFTVVRLTEASGLVMPEGPFEGNALTWTSPAPGFAAVFLRVQNRTTKVATDLIKPLLSKTGSSVIAVGDSDLLLVADLTPRLRLAAEFLSQVDIPQSKAEVLEVPLTHVSPGEVLSFVKDLGTKRETASQRPPGEVFQQPGANSLLVLAPKESLGFWKDLIERLDTQQSLETRNYVSRQVDAKALAKLVEQVAGVETAAAVRGPSSQEKTKVIVDEFTGTLIVTATASQHTRIAELLARIDSATGGPPKQVRTFPIRNRPVKEVVSVLTQLLTLGKLESSSPLLPKVDGAVVRRAEPPTDESSKGEGGTKKDTDKVQVTSDDGTNTLIVIGEPRILSEVEELLKTLDVRQPQVMIEVAMISLSDGQSLALGVELDKITSAADGTVRLSSLFGSAAGAAASVAPGLGATASYIKTGDFTAVLRAYEAINNGRSASLPSVLVGNNQQATFSSVVQQPTGTISTDTTSTTTRGFGGFQDAGTRINVKPQIAEGDHLVLTYNVELSSFTGKAADGLPGARQQNTVSSVAMIPDGHAVVVGGLELTTESEDTSQVPLLSQIPLFGELFKSRSTGKDRTRFYVFIRANVMRDGGFEDLKYTSTQAAEKEGVSLDDGWPKVTPRVMK